MRCLKCCLLIVFTVLVQSVFASNEIHCVSEPDLSNPYFQIMRASDLYIYNFTASAYQASPSWADTDTPATEHSVKPGFYYASMPTSSAGDYYVFLYDNSSPADTDEQLKGFVVYWDGSAMILFSTINSTANAIKTKTDNLPTDPADDSDIDSQLQAIDDYIDTEIDAIKAKTDNLPTDPADDSDIDSQLQAIDDYIDTEIDAIKTKTDGLNFTGDDVKSTLDGETVKLSSDGLDSVSTTAPSGVASNFREMLVQVWRRFFKKVDETSTQIKTYADNDTSVLTTQTITIESGTTTVGAAE